MVPNGLPGGPLYSHARRRNNPHRKIEGMARTLLLYLCCASAVFGDQVILKNGDRITGTIVKKDGSDLVIKSDSFGTVTTKWDQVESIQGDTPVHVVENDGKTVEVPVSSLNSMRAQVKAIRNADEQRNFERL